MYSNNAVLVSTVFVQYHASTTCCTIPNLLYLAYVIFLVQMSGVSDEPLQICVFVESSGGGKPRRRLTHASHHYFLAGGTGPVRYLDITKKGQSWNSFIQKPAFFERGSRICYKSIELLARILKPFWNQDELFHRTIRKQNNDFNYFIMRVEGEVSKSIHTRS